MYRASATITLGASEKPGPRGYPAEGLPSFLYRFGSEMAQAWIRAADGSALGRPWAGQVELDFLVSDRSLDWYTEHVVVGAKFGVWYGRDIGAGRIDSILDWSARTPD